MSNTNELWLTIIGDRTPAEVVDRFKLRGRDSSKIAQTLDGLVSDAGWSLTTVSKDALDSWYDGALNLLVREAERTTSDDGASKWCLACREWHPLGEFAVDRSRGDGLEPSCCVPERRHGAEQQKRWAAFSDPSLGETWKTDEEATR